MKQNRLTNLFTTCREENRAALIGYLTAGDPNVQHSEKLLHTLASQVDIIEIGMPFSDPMADGPVIEAASERALAAGCVIQDVFDLANSVRRQFPTIGIVLMGYANIPYVLGFEKFSRQAAESGVDGVLLVDIPPEESDICSGAFAQNNLDQIFLLSPTSSEERIQRVAAVSSGFIYYVTLTGITGAEIGAVKDIEQRIALIKQYTNLPVCVGFGIKTPEQAGDIAQFSDGVIVGSQFVRKVTGFNGDLSKSSAALLETSTSMRLAMNRVKT